MTWLRPCKDRWTRWIVVLILAPLLASCQTTPAPSAAPAFTPEQVAMLEAHDFVEAEGQWELGLEGKLLFPVEKSALAGEQLNRLKTMAAQLAGVGIVGARVDGHADATGTEAYNRQLSLERAHAVRRALVAGGMKEGSVEARGLGSSQPVEDNRTSKGRRENRRVTIIVSPGDVDPS